MSVHFTLFGFPLVSANNKKKKNFHQHFPQFLIIGIKVLFRMGQQKTDKIFYWNLTESFSESIKPY